MPCLGVTAPVVIVEAILRNWHHTLVNSVVVYSKALKIDSLYPNNVNSNLIEKIAKLEKVQLIMLILETHN